MFFYRKIRIVVIVLIKSLSVVNALPSSKQLNLTFIPNKRNIKKVCKRTSRFALHSSGTITVEAALMFPLFLAGCMSLLFFIELFRMESCMTQAMINTARTMGQYTFLYDFDECVAESALLKSGIQGINSYAAGCMVINEIGEEQLEHSFIVGGVDGVSFLGSYVNEAEIKIMVHYNVQFPVPFFQLPSFPITQCCYLHGWSGETTRTEECAEDEIVFITPYGTVYHRNKKCNYLKLSVMEVYYEQLRVLRNSSGGKYYACEICAREKEWYEKIYITREGERYHMLRNCTGLKRSVQAVFLSAVEHQRSCCRKCDAE